MNTDDIPGPKRDTVDQLDLLRARELALEAGSAITTACHQDAMVMANTAPIDAFVFSGLPGYTGLRARCSAVAAHLKNIKIAATRESPRPSVMDNPGEFLRAAGNYARYLSGQDRADGYWLRSMFRREIGDKGDMLYQILRDSNGGRDATPSRIAWLLGTVSVQAILPMLREAEVRGLARPSGKTWPAWPEEKGDEDSWVLSESGRDGRP